MKENWQKAETLKSLTRREAKEETEKMASKKKMVAFRYDKNKKVDMEAVFDIWAISPPKIAADLPAIFGAWRRETIQLLLPRSTAMKLISNWEVI